MPLLKNTTVINNHTWKDDVDFFCADYPVGPIVWAAFSSFGMVIGLPASIWLMWVLIQRQRAGLRNDVYMLNIAVMDLIFLIYIVPSVLNQFVWKSTKVSQIIDLPYFFIIGGRPLFMACVCMDCYCAVLWPVQYLKIRQGPHRRLASLVVWICTLAHGSICVFADHFIGFAFLTIPTFLSLPIIIICDVVILCALKKPGPGGNTDVHPQKQRALQVITISLLMTLISYLPTTMLFCFVPLTSLSGTEGWCKFLSSALIGPVLGSTIMTVMSLQNLGKLRILRERCLDCA